MPPLSVKLCGIRTPDILDEAIRLRATFAGFVHFSASPRHASIEQMAALVRHAHGRIKTVAVLVDADDALLSALASAGVDYFQLHGEESPARAAEIRTKFQRPIIRAIRVENTSDILAAKAYDACADWLLFDAKAPTHALPGGTGQSFDWTLLAGASFAKPWMLSGGLHAGNLRVAVQQSGAKAVDVSSGIERAKGIKDVEMMKQFMNAAMDVSV
jgi:phosphoribosylanthranilate isomerase